MRVCIIAVPYDSGIRGVRMGLGPDRLIESGLARRLRAEGHVVDVVVTELAPSHPAEIASSFELMASVAERVRKALAGGCFPVVLSGNCSASVGVLAALDEPSLIWLDAHADFESPDETTSGFLDGMALSILAGRCWHSMAAEIEGFSPIPGKRVAFVGARDVSAAEEAALAKFGVLRISSEEVRNADGLARFTAFAEEARLVHIHLDLDVLDPAYGRANSFAAPGGIAPSEVTDLISHAAGRTHVTSLSVASYDPSFDTRRRVPAAAQDAIATAVRAASSA